MKNLLKQFSIAFAILAIGYLILTAWGRWIIRPQSFADIFPTAVEEIDRCEVEIQYDGPDQVSGELTPDQLEELLDRLEQTRYKGRLSNITDRFSNSVTGIPTTISPTARLYLEKRDQLRVELMLCGNTFVVNPLQGSNNPGGHYDTEGGSQFQKELIDWLEDAINKS